MILPVIKNKVLISSGLFFLLRYRADKATARVINMGMAGGYN